MAIGDEVLAQVSYPRQPCYKLNHRFEVKDMSRRSQTQARTGWYYRILREGTISEGDEIRLVKRINPKWTVADVQHYLYIEMKNEEAMRKIIVLEGLGAEIRTIFRNRLNKQFEDQEGRLNGGEGMSMNKWSDYKLIKKKMQTPRIASLRFEATQLVDNPAKVEPGSHVRIKLGKKLVRAYSVVTGDSNTFELGVALDHQTRGGSKYIHEAAKQGDIFSLGEIRATFPLSEEADHHIIIAGGIGITAFITAALFLQDKKQSYELHFAVRSAADIPFKHYLESLGDNVIIYDKSKGDFLSVGKVLARSNDNSHVYCCGPKRLMDGVAQAAESSGVPESHVHFEAFEITTSGDPFTAECVMSNKTVEVEGSKTLLDVLKDAGFDVDSSCETGNCGTCRVGVKSGKVQHRGTALLDSEKDTAMLSCVSRGIGHIVLDL
jgi:ferredoxin-NADP reductase